MKIHDRLGPLHGKGVLTLLRADIGRMADHEKAPAVDQFQRGCQGLQARRLIRQEDSLLRGEMDIVDGNPTNLPLSLRRKSARSR